MKRKILPYKPYLAKLARKLRNDMTFSEVLLWNELKRGQIFGIDFDRQRPILGYIVDFYCKDIMLAIEIDGDSHDLDEGEDLIRQKRIEQLGVHFLRFEDIEVKKDIENILSEIRAFVESALPTPPAAPLQGGE